MDLQPFFDFAHLRHNIYLDRQAGKPKPWTDDPILSYFKFTNVYRELDATTIWFRENVRDPLRSSPHVFLATVLFRFFNRTTTGEAIFVQTLSDGLTPWDHIVKHQEAEDGIFPTELLHDAIKTYCGKGPYVTGAYIIKSPNGMNKLDGVIWSIEQFAKDAYHLACRMDAETSLEGVWDVLRGYPYLGDFTAYEVVTDLRFTDLLSDAPDIMTWANPGPGAMRGLNRIHGRDKDKRKAKHLFIAEIKEILDRAPEFGFDDWEMREVEHTLCEFDKYERVRLGEGRPRGVYR